MHSAWAALPPARKPGLTGTPGNPTLMPLMTALPVVNKGRVAPTVSCHAQLHTNAAQHAASLQCILNEMEE